MSTVLDDKCYLWLAAVANNEITYGPSRGQDIDGREPGWEVWRLAGQTVELDGENLLDWLCIVDYIDVIGGDEDPLGPAELTDKGRQALRDRGMR
jgi:hypothetical protein